VYKYHIKANEEAIETAKPNESSWGHAA